MLAPDTNVSALQRRLFRLTALVRGAMAGALAATTLGAGVAIAQAFAVSTIVATVYPAPAHDAGTGASVGVGVGVRAQMVALLALLLARALLTGAGEWCGQRAATRIKSHVRTMLVEHLTARGPRALAGERTGELVTTIVDGVEQLDAYYRRFVPQMFATAIVPCLIVLAIAWIDLPSALLLAVTGPLILVFMWLLGTLAAQRTREQWHALSALGGRFLDTLQGLSTLALCGRAQDAADRLDAASEGLRVRTMAVLKVAFLSGFVLELAATLGTALVAVSVGVRMIEGWIAFQPGLTVLLLAPEFYLPFRQLGQRHHAGMEGVAAAERIFALLDAPALGSRSLSAPALAAVSAPATSHDVDAGQLPSVALSLTGATFSYPGAARPALRDVTLDFPARTLTAIVGPSGAGKSTLVALLLRFVTPSEGEIRANGLDANACSAARWREQIALVPQRPHFFEGSILDNLRLARPGASHDDVRAAARMAEADAFISALPHGYDTPLDETAARLSGGERQRLAIARALLKPAPILILDEPSSSLDPVSEAAITRVLAALSRERTIIVIAHRLATVRQADRIIVLNDGRIAEAGRHEELLRGGGLYARMVDRHRGAQRVQPPSPAAPAARATRSSAIAEEVA
jgi:thiol reductant ABC exporter CydD subunit